MNPLAPYDLIADRWTRDRKSQPFREKKYVDHFIQLAEADTRILDPGCGSGEPIARYIID